jgi:phosphotransferase system  glucose/maltose/N-acetylglucosamine-specific IIC component
MAKFSEVNEHVADFLANSLSTMAMFYGVGFLVVSILFFQMPKSPLEWVQYIVQSFFQGVALPVLAFVAKTEGLKTERILQETHDTVMSELAEIKAMMPMLNKIETEEEEILKDEEGQSLPRL